MASSRSGLRWAFALVIVGALLLLQTLGLAPPGVWGAALPLWPVLLLALGLHMWFGRRTRLAAVLPAALAAGALAFAALRVRIPSPAARQSLVQYAGTAQSAAVAIELRAADLHLAALDHDALLMEGGGLPSPGESLEQNYQLTGGLGRLTLTQRLDTLLAPFLAAPGLAPRWEVRLTPALPLSLAVRAAGGSLSLDLASLQLTALDLRTEAADAAVVFPAHGATAQLRSTSGDLSLTLPSSVPVRLTVDARPGRLQIPPFLIREGQVFVSPGFSPAADFLDLHVISAIGYVTVD